MIAFLRRLGRCGGRRRPVDGFMEDRVVGIMFFHGGEVVWAFKEMLALARGIFRTHGLTVDALSGETLIAVKW